MSRLFKLCFGTILLTATFGCTRTTALHAPLAPTDEILSGAAETEVKPAKELETPGLAVSGSDCQTLLLGTFPLSEEPQLQIALLNAAPISSEFEDMQVTESYYFFLIAGRKCLSVEGTVRAEKAGDA